MQARASDAAMIGMLAGLLLVPLLMYGVRRLLLMHLIRRMFVDSAQQARVDETALSGELRRPAGSPRFAWHTTEDAMRRGASPQTAWQLTAARHFNRVFLLDLAFSLVYLFLLPFLATFVLILVVARWFAHRKQFQAADLSGSRERDARRRRLAWLWKAPVNLLLWAAGSANTVDRVGDVMKESSSPRWRGAMILVVMAMSVLFGRFHMLPFLSVHAALMYRQMRRANRTPGIGLLVLRVFNDEASSSFTFSGLMNRWRHFGPHYTVVDGALVAQSRTNREWRSAFILLVSWGALAAAWNLLYPGMARRFGDPVPTAWAWALVLLPALVGAGIVLALGRRRINGLFVRSREHLMARLARIDRGPRHLDLSFRHLRALCHNNVWFLAVHEFARCSQVVLMDLRSFTAERQGCRTEIEFLFNAVPAGRVLFLVSDAHADAVTAALQEIWPRQRAASVNLMDADPQLHLFRCQVNDAYDMQAILQRLVELADRQATRGFETISHPNQHSDQIFPTTLPTLPA